MGFLKKREMKRDRPAQEKWEKKMRSPGYFVITLTISIPLKRKEKNSIHMAGQELYKKKLSLQVPHKTYF
jgi:hypothetical protein